MISLAIAALVLSLFCLFFVGRVLWIVGSCVWGDGTMAELGWSLFICQSGAVFTGMLALGAWNAERESESRRTNAVLAILGCLFLLDLNIFFAVPLVQHLSDRLPLLLHGEETQGKVLRVYQEEVVRQNVLFGGEHRKRLLSTQAEYEFRAGDGRMYRHAVELQRKDIRPGQIVPVCYLPERPQVSTLNYFINKWADSLIMGAASLGSLCLTLWLLLRPFKRKSRRRRFRYHRRH